MCWKLILHNQKLKQVLFVIYRSVSLVVKSHPALIQLAGLLGLVSVQHKELQINLTGYYGAHGLHFYMFFNDILILHYKISTSNYCNVFIHSNTISYIEVTSITRGLPVFTLQIAAEKLDPRQLESQIAHS